MTWILPSPYWTRYLSDPHLYKYRLLECKEDNTNWTFGECTGTWLYSIWFSNFCKESWKRKKNCYEAQYEVCKITIWLPSQTFTSVWTLSVCFYNSLLFDGVQSFYADKERYIWVEVMWWNHLDVYGMVHIKYPLLLIRKSSPWCGDRRFPILLSEWSL